MPPVVTLQNLTPQALNQAAFANAQQAGLINRIFQEISASFNAPTIAAPAPASLTAASVTPAATLGSGNQNQAVGSGSGEQSTPQAHLEAAPQILNSTPASGNSDQSQDVQSFQNFLRSSVVFDSEKFTFSVDQVNAPNAPVANPALAGTTLNNQVPVTQGTLPPVNSPQSGSQPAPGVPSNSPVAAPLALNAASQPAAGTTVNETVSAASMFTNTVIAAQTVRPVTAPGFETENLQNNNQTLPADSTVTPVQPVGPILAQGVNSLTTVAQFSALKQDAFRAQDALAGVDNSGQSTADSAALAGSGSFAQALQANSPTAQNPPINAAGIIQQFAEQIAQNTSQIHTVSRLSFQLVPESLGKVTIQVALVDQSVSARIIVSNADVKEGLQNHMVDLKAALSQAGLQIDQLQVQIQGGSANLLAQYYQYQQEGSSYRSPVEVPGLGAGSLGNDENTGVLGVLSQRNSLVNLLI
jgi:flagellar hook-length control protein FliK